MKRQVFILLTLVLATLLGPAVGAKPTAASPIRYRVEDLGVLPGSYPSSIAQGINEQGQVVGWSGGSPYRAFVYTDGIGMVALPNPANYPWGCFAQEINDAGEVAGSCGLGTTDQPVHGFRWSAGGAPQDLGDLGNYFSNSYALNNQGAVVGQTGEAGNFLQQAFLYTDEQGMVDITPLEGLSIAMDINDRPDGVQIAGWDGSVAFRWENGVETSLGAPTGYVYSFGYGINDLGTVVGSVKTLHDEGSSFARYTDSGGWQTFTGFGRRNTFQAVNNAGVVVGVSAENGVEGDQGVIYTDQDGVQRLNDLIDAAGVWSIAGAYDINEAGQIAAQGMLRASGEFHAVRLTPIEGPTCTSRCARATDITLAGSLQGSTVRVRGRVQVRDETGAPLPLAVVEATWMKPDGSAQHVTVPTNRNGVAVFNTSGSRGTYSLSITTITRQGYTFDPLNSELTASITR